MSPIFRGHFGNALGSKCKHGYPKKLNNMPAATAEPITPATLGAIACIRR